MKLLTLNTHSLIEQNYEQKLISFVNVIAELAPDIIALQEVNQTYNEKVVPESDLTGYYPCQAEIAVTEDNHSYRVCKALRQKGTNYYWSWLPIKNGYEKFDEGLAVLSRKPIIKTDVCLVSGINDYRNWKTRKLLGVLTEDKTADWFYSVHLSWWNDLEEPFLRQWEKLGKHIHGKKAWLMGDFNNPAEIRKEGYDKIVSSGWYDTYDLALKKDSGLTVDKVIDGWKDKLTDTNGMRIDQIWTNHKEHIKSSEVVFNGKNGAIVSDHFGVLLETGE